MNLGRPVKRIQHLGITYDLYSATTLRKMLGKKYSTLLSWEKNGFIPKALFLSGERRYYTYFELKSLADIVLTYGIPKFKEGVKSPFSDAIHKAWGEIRQSILKGKLPAVKLTLEFDSKAVFLETLRDSLAIYGLRGDVMVERVAETLLEKAGRL